MFINYYLSLLDQITYGPRPKRDSTTLLLKQIRINLDSEVGTSKLFLINIISSYLQNIQRNNPILALKSLVVRLIPTGSISYNISNSTIYSLLRIEVNKAYNKLDEIQLQELRNNLRDIYYIIIDEKSIVSLKIIYAINARLKQVYEYRPLLFSRD